MGIKCKDGVVLVCTQPLAIITMYAAKVCNLRRYCLCISFLARVDRAGGREDHCVEDASGGVK